MTPGYSHTTMRVRAAVLACCLAASLAGGYLEEFRGYQVFIMKPPSSAVKYLRELQQDHAYEFLTRPVVAVNPQLVVVPPSKQKEFVDFMKAHHVPSDIFIEDLRAYMINEENKSKKNRSRGIRKPVRLPPDVKARYKLVNKYVRVMLGKWSGRKRGSRLYIPMESNFDYQ